MADVKAVTGEQAAETIREYLQKSEGQSATQTSVEQHMRSLGVPKETVLAGVNLLLTALDIQLYNSNDTMLFRLTSSERKEQFEGLDMDAVLLFQLIEAAGNIGIWTRDLRFKSNVTQPKLGKELKNLEAKKLIKSVKSISQKNKKVYMLFDLEPSHEVTGGPWYTDQEFDTAFYQAIRRVCIQFIESKEAADAEQVLEALSESGILVDVNLQVHHIVSVLQACVYDRVLQATPGSDEEVPLYSMARVTPAKNAFSQTPCGVCPVRHSCRDEGPISPLNCKSNLANSATRFAAAMRYCQIVMGPAGSGKSTYCHAIQQHCENIHRSVHVVNLDPAAEHFKYKPSMDIRELINVDDVMDELQYGPNGGLLFCMEHLLENMDWLEEQVGEFTDDYLILDCPGQIELYSHVPVMRGIVEALQRWGYNVGGLYLIDSHFISEPSKFLSGVLACLAAMVQLEIPHINVLTKCDLVPRKRNLGKFLLPDMDELLADLHEEMPAKFRRLNEAMASLIEDYSLVAFVPLNIDDPDSITALMAQIDNAIQFGEDEEVRDDLDPDSRTRGDDDDAAAWGEQEATLGDAFETMGAYPPQRTD